MGTYKGFTKVQLRKPERSKFDLSHEKKLSTRMGKLVPVFVSETLPNDTFRVNSEIMLRLAPLLAPIYHRVNVFVHFFFVPMRLLWDKWEPFITNGRLGTEDAPEMPYLDINMLLQLGNDYLDTGSLADYLGVGSIPDSQFGQWNPGGVAPRWLSPWSFAAYYKIWYDYYRDRNYVEDNEILPLSIAKNEDSPNMNSYAAELMALRTRDWQKDYFTSALPWTQRGDEVLMPVEGAVNWSYKDVSEFRLADGSLSGGGAIGVEVGSTTGGIGINGTFDNTGRIENIEDMSFNNNSVSINDLRQAVRLQEWLERNAVAGSRYNESIMAHFARRTSDGRLQRAEFLGGGMVPVQISEVMTTAWSQDAEANDIPPANMTGRAIAYAKNNGFTYNCEEHGFVMGIMSVMPKSAYMNGTLRMHYRRNTFLDYPWPSFGHLGEQAVDKVELYTSPANWPLRYGEDPVLFGYQSQYADWKWLPSTAHGDFRTTLEFWHLDRKFASSPSLGSQFVNFEDTLQDRVFAVAEADTLWCYIYNNASVVRSLPYFGTPML